MAAPSGTITMLFTDIEGSTRLLQRLGPSYSDVLDDHHRLMRDAFTARGGHEEGTEGDSFFVTFERASDGLAAALDAQLSLHAHEWPPEAAVGVRMGLHTGEVIQAGGGYVGMSVHEAARIGAAGHGGQILVSAITRELAEAPEGVGFRDLGEHWLKDLANPQHLFQVAHADLPSDFGPLRSHGRTPHNLPAQTTSLVGRQRETEEVAALVAAHRLVTITGAGGAGKSRLALGVGAEVIGDFGDGVWIVELAPHDEAASVVDALGVAIGLPAGRPMEHVEDYLRARTALVVLDNCEHLIDPAAEMANALLRACPAVKILTTSREPLGLPGEVAWRLPSLALPPADEAPTVTELGKVESVDLFCRRARGADVRFSLTQANAADVVRICRQLDGIPLALELAAARVGTLGVDQVAGRLDQRFRLLTGGSRVGLARQRTLQATVDWSYELLGEKERLLLRRLGAFVGGWTLDAAIAVCSDEHMDELDVIDLLAQLVSKSLVSTDETTAGVRYRFLETIRQYALDRLLETGELEAVRDRHLAWARDHAERAWSSLVEGRSGEDDHPLEPLERELENLRTAMDWALDRDVLACEAIVGASFILWVTQDRRLEGQRRLRAVLDAAPPGQRVERFRALTMWVGMVAETGSDVFESVLEEVELMLAGLPASPETAWCASELEVIRSSAAIRRGASEESFAHARLSLELAQGSTSPLAIFRALNAMVTASLACGDFDTARSSVEESRRIVHSLGWRVPEIRTLISRLLIEYRATGVPPRDVAEEAVRAGRDVGDPRTVCIALQYLGISALHDKRVDEAVHLLEEALATARRYGITDVQASVTQNVGWFRYLLGDLDGARTRTEEALDLHARAEAGGVAEAACLHALGEVARASGRRGEACRLLLEGARKALGAEAAGRTVVATCLEGLGGLAAAAGQGPLAALALGAAESCWPDGQVRRPLPAERELFARDLALARRLAGEDFEKAFESSHSLSPEEALSRLEAELPEAP